MIYLNDNLLLFDKKQIINLCAQSLKPFL